jgi:hypothetical protein
MVRRVIARIISAFLLVTVLSSFSHAQRPIATVRLNMEKLTNPETRDKLANLKEELERYVNDKEWTDNSYQYNIPVQIDILFERMQPTSHEDRWDARFILSNGSDYQASDKRWSFPYMIGKPFYQEGKFHPLTGMIDFYMNIMLGRELDKKKKLGGTPYYQKALDVVQLAKFSEFYSSGWKERQTLITKILSEDQIPLRELEYFFNQANQWFRVDNRKTASQYLRVIVMKLEEINPDSDELNRFYQLHHLDLARLMSVLGMREELETLKRLNPANADTYQKFIDQIQ